MDDFPTVPGAPADGLRLRPPGPDDEAGFRRVHAEFTPGTFTFGLGYTDGDDWGGYLASLRRLRRGDDLPEGFVPATFLVAVVRGEIVGRASVRYRLNDWLLHEGGHIGYGVAAPFRRRGHATEILRQSLVVARAAGVDRVLVTCDDTNAGSAAVIERCGGVLEDRRTAGDGHLVRRYWID